jgi:hypothetical protein
MWEGERMLGRFFAIAAAIAALLLVPTAAQAVHVFHGDWGGDVTFRVTESNRGDTIVRFTGDYAQFGDTTVGYDDSFNACRSTHHDGAEHRRCIRGEFTSAGHASGEFWLWIHRPGEHGHGHVTHEWTARFGR